MTRRLRRHTLGSSVHPMPSPSPPPSLALASAAAAASASAMPAQSPRRRLVKCVIDTALAP
eukprot:6947068-Prymnesium_polylepis.1